ncbi:hypothetical protein HMPREF1545_03296 [Oscillibacter sp. KLE 1728]|nr:hypothetical protein HMPREF1545_03296 [Oscillibacter sp. KLE 1728]
MKEKLFQSSVCARLPLVRRRGNSDYTNPAVLRYNTIVSNPIPRR